MNKTDSNERLARYQSASTIPLLITGFVYLASFIAVQIDGEPATALLFSASWLVFMLDYAIQLALAPEKWRFVASHPLYLLSLAFPPLRIWLLLTFAMRLARNGKSSLTNRVGLVSLVAVAAIIVFGALLTLMFEQSPADANIETYGESLWWASATLTTVGYGDFVPVSTGGRFTGILVFSVGVAALAVLTATIVGMFTKSNAGLKPVAASSPDAPDAPDAPEHHAAPAKDSQLDAVMAKLEEINTRLVAIEQTTERNPGAASPTLSEDRRTVESDEGSAHSQPNGDSQ